MIPVNHVNHGELKSILPGYQPEPGLIGNSVPEIWKDTRDKKLKMEPCDSVISLSLATHPPPISWLAECISNLSGEVPSQR